MFCFGSKGYKLCAIKPKVKFGAHKQEIRPYPEQEGERCVRGRTTCPYRKHFKVTEHQNNPGYQ